jgi:hypothetical protein
VLPVARPTLLVGVGDDHDLAVGGVVDHPVREADDAFAPDDRLPISTSDWGQRTGHLGDAPPRLKRCVKQLLTRRRIVVPVGSSTELGARLGVLALGERHLRFDASSADSIR